jgi:hypothetical protein
MEGSDDFLLELEGLSHSGLLRHSLLFFTCTVFFEIPYPKGRQGPITYYSATTGAFSFKTGWFEIPEVGRINCKFSNYGCNIITE